MPSTHLSLNCHIVFSTRNREPWIGQPWRDQLHAYIGGIISQMHGIPLAIGGVADHVHVLVGLRATHSLAEMVRDMKRGSSRWVHETRRLAAFAWQEGYGAFTVSPSRVEAARTYICNQAEHHRRKTFQEEYLELLKEANIEYDERYLW